MRTYLHRRDNRVEEDGGWLEGELLRDSGEMMPGLIYAIASVLHNDYRRPFSRLDFSEGGREAFVTEMVK
jgi:hypothetical protein